MNYTPKELEKMAQHLSQREKLAQKASRDSIKYKQCEYLSDKIGKLFDGIITSIQHYGIFVEIIENGCEGLIKKSDLGPGDWIIEPNKYQLINKQTNQIMKLGDKMKVILKSIDLERKEINMKYIDIY